MPHDVFISHSSRDRTHANALCAALEAAGLRCWVAPRDVVPGGNWPGKITRAIEASKVMVLVFSKNANVSQDVLNEVVLAARKRIHIINFRVDETPVNDDLRYHLEHRHWMDALTSPMAEHHARTAAAIRTLLARQDSSSLPPTLTPASPPSPSRWKKVAAVTAVVASLLVLAAILGWRARQPSSPPTTAWTQVTVASPAHPGGATVTLTPTAPLTAPSPTLRTPRRVKPGESIQDALDKAQPGDTVQVAAGNYREQLNFNKEGIRLEGEGKEKTFVRFEGTQGPVLTVWGSNAGEITGLTFEHIGPKAKGEYPVALLRTSKVRMHNCAILNSAQDGIKLEWRDTSIIENCEVRNCNNTGIAVSGEGTGSTIRGNRVWDNQDTGIGFYWGAGGLAEKNLCQRNSIGICAEGEKTAPTLQANIELSNNRIYGIAITGGSNALVRDNLCERNLSCGYYIGGEGTAPKLINNKALRNAVHGLMVTYKGKGQFEGNTCNENGYSGIAVFMQDTSPRFDNNNCNDNIHYGFFIDYGATPAGIDAAGNKASGNIKGQKFTKEKPDAVSNAPAAASSPSSGTRFVKPGASIQLELDNSGPGDTVSVAAGEYTESLTFKEGVRLIGAGKDKIFVRSPSGQGAVLKVLRCDLGEISNLCFEHIAATKADDGQSVIDLDGSKVEIRDCVVRNSRGAGIHSRGKDRSTVTKCEVTGCSGGGIIIFDPGTAPILRENYIRNNRGNGLSYFDGAGGLAEGNQCENNWHGFYLRDKGTTPTLRKNMVFKNKAYGIYLQLKAGGIVEENVFQENRDSGIGVFDANTTPQLTGNCCQKNGTYGIHLGSQAKPTGTDTVENEASRQRRGQLFREPKAS